MEPTAITKESQYVRKPNAIRAKRYQRVIPSLGNNPSSGYAMGDTIIFYLPGGLNNQVMDGQSAYLRFAVKPIVAAAGGNVAATAQTFALDYTGSSIIRRLDIYGSGGSLIESIDNYNALANVLYDVSHSQSELQGLSSMIGSSETFDFNPTTATTGVTTAVDSVANFNAGFTAASTTTLTAQNRLHRRGMSFVANDAQVTDGNNNENTNQTQYVFSIPILSALFQLSEKYIPIYALNDDIRVEIVLDTTARAFVAPTVTDSTFNAKIMSPEIIVDYLEMESSALAQMQQLYAGMPLTLHATSYHNYQTTITAATQNNFNTILPAKVLSAKNALVIFRELGDTGVAAGYSQSSRTNPFTGSLSQFNLQIGGMRVPQRPITANKANDITEFFSELQKAFHALGDTRFAGCLNRTCYTSSANVAAADLPNERGFVAGINLDTLVRQSDVIMSGMDMSKVTTYLEANFTTATQLLTVDTWIHHDILLIVDPTGSLVSRY